MSVEKPIELRKVIPPSDTSYEFVSNIKKFLGTESKSIIVDFILARVITIPFDEFLRMINHTNENQKEEEPTPTPTQ